MKRIYTILGMVCLLAAALMVNGQEVKINTNLVVEADGTMRMDGEATVWDDVMVFPDGTNKGGNVPPTWTRFKRDGAGTSQGVFLWFFDPSTEQEVFFTIQMPHSYKTGTDLKPHVHWTTITGTPGNNVVWGLEYSIQTIGGVFPNTTTSTNNTIIETITPSGTNQHLITSLGTISGSGMGISSIISCRLFRKAGDGADTFANSVGLLGFDIHFEKDTDGSRSEFTK